MDGGSAWSPSFSSELIVSYSQNAEDVRLWRIFRAVEDGFYVDVGAADPDTDSVTRLFYEHGWSGINVEPSPCFEALHDARTRDVNLRVAVGTVEGSVSFNLTYPYLGTSTVDLSFHSGLADVIERVEETVVPQRRLESILREHAGGRTIHFLKVDVEGAEQDVLASSDWDTFRPIVVVVEAIEPWSTTPTHASWERILTDAGYGFAAFDGINRFYVDEAHDTLVPSLAYPISALDRYVTSSAHETAAELERTLEALREEAAESESLRRSLEQLRAELVDARRALDVVHASRTWRAGRIVATAAGPVVAVGERLRKGRSG